MIPEKAPRKRAAYGLPQNMTAFLESAQNLQAVFAKGLNPDGSYKPKTILALLKFRGVNVTALAELNNYDESYFRQVINRDCFDVNVEDIIAKKLKIDPNRMWGRRFLVEVNDAS